MVYNLKKVLKRHFRQIFSYNGLIPYNKGIISEVRNGYNFCYYFGDIINGIQAILINLLVILTGLKISI